MYNLVNPLICECGCILLHRSEVALHMKDGRYVYYHLIDNSLPDYDSNICGRTVPIDDDNTFLKSLSNEDLNYMFHLYCGGDEKDKIPDYCNFGSFVESLYLGKEIMESPYYSLSLVFCCGAVASPNPNRLAMWLIINENNQTYPTGTSI